MQYVVGFPVCVYLKDGSPTEGDNWSSADVELVVEATSEKKAVEKVAGILQILIVNGKISYHVRACLSGTTDDA